MRSVVRARVSATNHQARLRARETPSRDDLLACGIALVERLPERDPASASARVQHLYDDVRTMLGAPLVDSLFTVLANYPAWLEGAWEDVRDLSASAPSRRAAGGLRSKALSLTAGERELADLRPLLAIEAEARALTEMSLELLPRLMLIATAFERSDRRYVPAAPRRGGSAVRVRDFAVRHASRSPAARRSVPPALGIPLVDPTDTTGRLAAVLQDIRERHGHPLVTPYYRGLANWAALIVRLWAAVRPVVGTDRYIGWRNELVDQAEREWTALSSQDDRRDDARDAPHAVARVFRTRILPELLLDVAMLARLVGADCGGARALNESMGTRSRYRDAARESPASF